MNGFLSGGFEYPGYIYQCSFDFSIRLSDYGCPINKLFYKIIAFKSCFQILNIISPYIFITVSSDQIDIRIILSS